ncbi:MAG: DNA polymerase IV [Armatimonadota bacterium]|nr:DNA polymerase IV [Armatimonadota bacterium]MDR7404309.1 DNA polymerase IV [Armatimonadota bacterium]
MSRTILHVDMDAFFAAIEQQRRPELRGRPVVVGGSGDPRSRGVVSTASYEARAFGIHSGMPLRVAYRRCPHAVFLPVDIETYAAYSETIMAILREYTPLVEPLSLDEAFLDVSGHPDPRALAEEIRTRIRQQTGLTASIGIGPNKLLAKIASGLRKPDAVTEIRAEEAERVLAPLPVTALWGVGPKTAALLERELGVHTVGDLQRVSPQTLAELLGPRRAEELARASRGEDYSPVVTHWEPRSVGREVTYQRDVRRREILERTLGRLAEEVAADLRSQGYRARTVTVKIRYHDFRTHTRALTLPQPTDDPEQIAATARGLLDRFTLDRPVRLVGVRTSGLVKQSAQSTRSAPSVPNSLNQSD